MCGVLCPDASANRSIRWPPGVTAQQVHQPIDDDQYIVVDLDFASVEAENGFKEFLEQVIWQTPEMSPGLSGTPRARLLEEVRTAP